MARTRQETRSSSAGVLNELRSLANPANVLGMARYGISSKNTLGVSIPRLRAMAQRIGTDHALALELWASGIHEARILAALVDDVGRDRPFIAPGSQHDRPAGAPLAPHLAGSPFFGDKGFDSVLSGNHEASLNGTEIRLPSQKHDRFEEDMA